MTNMNKSENRIIAELKKGEKNHGVGNTKHYCEMDGFKREGQAVRSLIKKGLVELRNKTYRTLKDGNKWENYTDYAIRLNHKEGE